MVYLSGFRFPDRAQEANYMAFSPRARQTCYDSYYPFGLFEGRTLPELDFLEITILYGGNGSGKTTLLNVMADALRLYRRAEYNRTPFFDDYARLCEPRTMRRAAIQPVPDGTPHAARQCAHPLQRRERAGRVQRMHPRERAVSAG